MKKGLLFLIIGLIATQLSFAEIVRQTIQFDVPQIDGTTVLVENCLNLGREGEPLLPKYGAEILLPQGTVANEIRVVSAEFETLDETVEIQPASRRFPLSEEIPADYQLTQNEAIYNSDNPFPVQIIENFSTQFMAGHGIATFTVSPIRYFPQSNRVDYLTSVTLEIETASSNRANSNFLRADERVADLVSNPEMLNSYLYPTRNRDEEYDILLITNNNLLDDFSEYIEFKESTGFFVATMTTEEIYSQYLGVDNQERIRNCVIDYYENYGIQYVLLGGDSAPNDPSNNIIPHRGLFADPGSGYADSDIAADMYFGCLDGNWNNDNDGFWGEIGEEDLYAEVSVGRLCVDSATEIDNFVNKLIKYQDAPVVADLEKALMVGELLWNEPYPDGTYGGTYKNEIANGASTHGYTTEGISDNFDVSTLYDLNGAWGGSQIYSYFNSGLNLLNHLGHSNVDYNMKLYNSDISTSNFQNNGVNHGFVIGYSQGCYPGSFDNRGTYGSYGSDCFAEKITTISTGEVAFVCNSRYGWGEYGSTNGPSQYFDRQFFDAIFGEDLTAIGVANDDSKSDNVSYINGDNVIRFCAYELNLFGDPSMDIWTAAPTNISATYPPSIPIGSAQISFQTDAPNARIAILRNGELLARGVADGSGNATVEFGEPISSPEGLEVSIIAHNKNRYFGDIVVVSDQPYVIFDSYEILDPDGQIDWYQFNSSIGLSITVWNVGDQDATDISVLLSSEDNFIEIIDGTADFGTIPAGETVTVSGAFSISPVQAIIPDQHEVLFNVSASGNGENWDSYFTIPISAPVMGMGSIVIDDSAGDGDGIFDPGETVILNIPMENTGHSESSIGSAYLSTSSEWISITDEQFIMEESVGAQSSIIAVFEVIVDENTPVGTSVMFGFNVDLVLYGFSDVFGVTVGLIVEDFETGDFSQYPWELDGDANWLVTGNPYEGSFCAQSGDIAEWGETSLSMDISVLSDGEISFWKKVSCEEDPDDNWDWFAFYIDGVEQGRWDGEVAWSEEVYTISAGDHEVKWFFRKDGYVDSGSDCAWIDYVIFPPLAPPPVIAVAPEVIEISVPFGETGTDEISISNLGGGTLNYSINLEETFPTRNFELTEAEIAEKERYYETHELEAVPAVISPDFVAGTRTTDVTIVCDGGSWQEEVSWEIVDSNGSVVASGGAPFSGTVSMDNDTYTLYANDSYGDGWNGNYITITDDNDGTVYLNWTLQTGSSGNTIFEVNAIDPISWLELSASDGGVPSGQTDEVVLFFDATELQDGEIVSCDVLISSNDVDQPLVTVHVVLTVGEAGPECVFGDVNYDGIINILDIVMMVNFIVATDTPTDDEFCAADINEDEIINVLDIVQVINIIMGDALSKSDEVGSVEILIHENRISISTDTQIAGLQFQITGAEVENIAHAGFEFAENDGTVLMYSLEGETLSGDFDLFAFDGKIQIDETVVANQFGEAMDVTIIELPSEFALSQNYPNPFNPTTVISYQLPVDTHGRVSLQIYNLRGQLVETLVNEPQDAGFYSMEWNGSNVSSGIYFYRLVADGFVSSHKMVLMK